MDKYFYKDPEVKVYGSTGLTSGFDIWCESKETIVKVDEPNKMVIVDGDEINISKYLHEIQKMNMQYNNMPFVIFEIKGSILFRDLLYNINKASQWAVSQRLTHSIFDPNDLTKFPISSEYRGIKEWETALDCYLEDLAVTGKVDVSRVKMPYSIYSKYWVGMTQRTLVSLLSLLHNEMPFFYDLYGNLMIKAYDDAMKKAYSERPIHPRSIECYLSSEVDSGLTKYISKSEDFKEGVQFFDDYCSVKLNMGLILYSQFIRQADCDVRGLFDELIHSDIEDFKHKVFTGETLLKVTYTAHIDRLKHTLKDRLCWFSQSDGDDSNPNYWSKFISTLMKNVNAETVKSLLPCKFCGSKVTSCHFNQDLKFRDKGTQKGYIPCAIRSKNLNYAQQRFDECPNSLNKAYYTLTYDLVHGGIYPIYDNVKWTSKLTILADQVDNTYTVTEEIDTKLAALEYERNTFNSDEFKLNGSLNLISESLWSYAQGDDITCVMKGLAIDCISAILKSHGAKSYLINFGGDIYGHNVDQNIPIENSKFTLGLKGCFSVFTSGNTDKRGDHIPGGARGTSTVIVRYKSDDNYINAYVDALATKIHAKSDQVPELMNIIESRGNIDFLNLTENGHVLNRTYCASPFFNDQQVATRDQMISKFEAPFRPDLTESSKKYDEGSHMSHLVTEVVRDNEDGIFSSQYLVFPVDTVDLGTLYEVGYAIGLGIPVIVFNQNSDEYLINFRLGNEPLVTFDNSNKYIFNCGYKRDVITLGYVSAIGMSKNNIYYTLGNNPDNIMLSVNFHHIEKDKNNKYELIERDLDERDR